MSPEENMCIVRRIYAEVFDRHNLDVINEYYTADFVYHSPGNPDFDRESLKQGLAAYITAFPDVRLTVEDIFAAGDRVAVRFSAIGTQRGEYMDVPPTGKQVTVTSILIHRLAYAGRDASPALLLSAGLCRYGRDRLAFASRGVPHLPQKDRAGWLWRSGDVRLRPDDLAAGHPQSNRSHHLSRLPQRGSETGYPVQ